MKMITINEAVAGARKFLVEIFPESAGDTRLEEVERDGEHWLVTFSFPGLDKNFMGSPFEGPRQYKIVKVNAQNGAAESVKIRELAS